MFFSIMRGAKSLAEDTDIPDERADSSSADDAMARETKRDEKTGSGHGKSLLLLQAPLKLTAVRDADSPAIATMAEPAAYVAPTTNPSFIHDERAFPTSGAIQQQADIAPLGQAVGGVGAFGTSHFPYTQTVLSHIALVTAGLLSPHEWAGLVPSTTNTDSGVRALIVC